MRARRNQNQRCLGSVVVIAAAFFASCVPQESQTGSSCPVAGDVRCGNCPGPVTFYCPGGMKCPSNYCSQDADCIDPATGKPQTKEPGFAIYNCGVQSGGGGGGGSGRCSPPTGCGNGWLNSCDNRCYATSADCSKAGPPQGCYSGTCRQCPP